MFQGEEEPAADHRVVEPTALRLPVDRSPDAPAVARHALQGWLTALGTAHQVVEDASLVIGELVTNAVRHAQSSALVVAEMHGTRLRLEVHDQGHGTPMPRAPDPSLGGYGLQLVAAIAHDWGWSPTPTGKCVWTEL